MTIIVPHRTTAEKAIAAIDRGGSHLFDGAGASVGLVDWKKSWNGPVMDFSVTAKVGFISLPISGTVKVDDVNVTIQCELPAIVDKFVGEDKIRTGIDRQVRGILGS